jgi:hypothetical protein
MFQEAMINRIKVFVFVSVFVMPVLLLAQPDRVNHNGRRLFVSGGNIAWINFGGDVGPGTTDLAGFGAMFREVRDNGGNSMRFWLHPTGNNLAWNGNVVSGLGSGFITDLTAILDSARTYDVSVMICLWSFDMLRQSNGTTSTTRNQLVLTDSVSLQRYIDNALIPMVTALKDHPAILAWEVFNEPEGMSNEFGWDGINKVPMSAIQRVVNRVAGAIHRVDAKLRVTNGAWSFKSTQDAVKQEQAKDMNYYRNDRLIAAGGDPDGKLDFYTVHYYDWAGTNLSPFHHHYDRWQLDKPLVVAEFYIKGAVYSVSADSLYKVLRRNGYAGAMAWQWVDLVQNRDNNTATWPNALKNMRFMRDNYLSDVSLTYNGMRLEKFTTSRREVEAGQNFQLDWTVRGAVSVLLNGAPVPPVQSRTVSLQETTVLNLVAISATGQRDSIFYEIKVLGANDVNRALQAVSTAYTGIASAAFDGNTETEWTGDGNGGFLAVELKESYAISSIKVVSGNQVAPVYQIEGSFDGVNWKKLAEQTNGVGGEDVFAFETPVQANRVRLVFPAGPVPSVAEMRVFGTLAAIQPPAPRLTAPVTDITVDNGITVSLTAAVTRGTEAIRRVIFYAGSDSLGQDTTIPYAFSWKTSKPGTFAVSAVAVTDGHRIQTTARTVVVNPSVQVRRFEAEASVRTGTLAMVTEATASGGSYIRMENDGTLTWNAIPIATAGEYVLRIGYRLPFDAKTQYININGNRVAEVVFDGAVNAWLTKDVPVPLISGQNVIQIEKFWGYMHVDFIEIRGDGQEVVANERGLMANGFELGSNYPNPFNPSTVIPFSLEQASAVKLDVLDINGRVVMEVANGRYAAGSYALPVSFSGLSSGVYMYRLTVGNQVRIRKLTLLR